MFRIHLPSYLAQCLVHKQNYPLPTSNTTQQQQLQKQQQQQPIGSMNERVRSNLLLTVLLSVAAFALLVAVPRNRLTEKENVYLHRSDIRI